MLCLRPRRRHAFAGVSALLFAASATATVAWGASMSAMGELPMAGGWTMSMAWLPACGQTWAGTAASFVGMWLVMMAAMMLPVVAPVLWRYREALRTPSEARRDRLTALAGLAYFFMWAVAGAAVFALGATVADAAMELPALARAVPVSLGMVLLLAGAFQFTEWKAHHLACCRHAPGAGAALCADAGAAWRYGVRLGLHCIHSCAGLTAILLVAGVMDLRAMAAVAAAIAAERLAPRGECVARVIGAVAIGAGLLQIARAAAVA